jgi:hypothetical protein
MCEALGFIPDTTKANNNKHKTKPTNQIKKPVIKEHPLFPAKISLKDFI